MDALPLINDLRNAPNLGLWQGRQTYLKITLEKVHVTHFSVHANGN